MRAGKIVLFLALFCVSAVVGQAAETARSAPSQPYNVLSDSFYHLDPAGGSMSVRVEATFYNNDSKDLAAIPLWAMPNAAGISVKSDGADLATVVTPFRVDFPAVVVATLAKPLKPRQKTDVVLTYDVGQQKNSLVNIAPGSIESMFVSQGSGSFLLLDVPAAAENYLDPGCVAGASQPSDVRDAGYKRWVCGEMLGSVFFRTEKSESACANREDSCRQRSLRSPFSAFAQSITDTGSRGLLEADVAMAERQIHVTFRFFKQNQKWAEKVLAVAKTALPQLEALFGYPYPFPDLSLRESTFIEVVGAAGVAYTSGGDVLITPIGGSFDSEVVVHELGHQWAGGNLTDVWEAEGLAEYAMRVLAPGLGFVASDRGWQRLGYKDNLALWGEGSAVRDADYWYGKAGAFFAVYEKAIGGRENMTKVLSQTRPDWQREPLDGRWLMDAGEDVSGANLDGLFLGWIFNPETATAALQERRAARDLVKGLTARGLEMGLTGTPSDIAGNLNAWTFSGVAAQVAQGYTVLDAYAEVVKLSADADLGVSPGVAKSWGSDTLAHTRGVIEDQRQAIQSLIDTRARLSSEPAGSPAATQLAEAHERYAEGDFAATKRLAAAAVTTAVNESAAGKMLVIAHSRRDSYSPSFLGRIGLFMSDPDRELAAADAAYANGDPARALALSRSAYETWNEANSRGLQRLAILAGLMCLLSTAAWWILSRLARPAQTPATRRSGGSGHVLDEAASRRSSWRDWENTR